MDGVEVPPAAGPAQAPRVEKTPARGKMAGPDRPDAKVASAAMQLALAERKLRDPLLLVLEVKEERMKGKKVKVKSPTAGVEVSRWSGCPPRPGAAFAGNSPTSREAPTRP